MHEPRGAGTNDTSELPVRPIAGRRVRSREIAGFVFAENLYGARAAVPMHRHALAGLAVVLDGGYVKRIDRQDHDCRPGTVTLEPAGVSHAEWYGSADARTVLIEVLPWRLTMIEDHIRELAAPVCARDSAAFALGRRAQRELRMSDSASSIVLEGLALELIALAARGVTRATERCASVPAWLAQVTARLRDEFRGDVGLSRLAADASVHPAHLARVFRAQEGCSVGEFVRRRRIEWTATQLTTTAMSLASLALSAGFHDQSHFTRVFTRQMGMSPARYRAHFGAGSR